MDLMATDMVKAARAEARNSVRAARGRGGGKGLAAEQTAMMEPPEDPAQEEEAAAHQGLTQMISPRYLLLEVPGTFPFREAHRARRASIRHVPLLLMHAGT